YDAKQKELQDPPLVIDPVDTNSDDNGDDIDEDWGDGKDDSHFFAALGAALPSAASGSLAKKSLPSWITESSKPTIPRRFEDQIVERKRRLFALNALLFETKTAQMKAVGPSPDKDVARRRFDNLKTYCRASYDNEGTPAQITMMAGYYFVRYHDLAIPDQSTHGMAHDPEATVALAQTVKMPILTNTEDGWVKRFKLADHLRMFGGKSLCDTN
ncbi:MAG: hypothetical protein KC476_11890, partial [Cyanobacteria bacterium HKST-UBA06]|nr:hypothetical protein [Cyanobacteria bacterium HKST-UBA06]